MKRKRRKYKRTVRKTVVLYRLSEAQRDAFNVLSLARREGISLSLAAKAEGIRPSTVRKLIPGVWRKHGKDYRAKRFDKIPRGAVTIYGPKGPEPIVPRNSRVASLVSYYDQAVHKYRDEGDASGLRAFRGKLIPGTKRKWLTGIKTLDKLKDAGLLSFKKFYREQRFRRG